MKKITKPAKSDIEPANSSHKENPPDQENHSFPIVGIGASAGDLEALEQFLQNVPEKSGMVFVIVQHLDPNYKGKGLEAELREENARLKKLVESCSQSSSISTL